MSSLKMSPSRTIGCRICLLTILVTLYASRTLKIVENRKCSTWPTPSAQIWQKNCIQQTPLRYVQSNCMTSVTSSNSISKEHTIWHQLNSISYDTCTANHPQSWERFFKILFPHWTKSVNTERKCDTMIQIIHCVIHNGKKHNPFHVSLTELFHDDSRAKLVIETLNKIGLYISYSELQRIDFGLMNE